VYKILRKNNGYGAGAFATELKFIIKEQENGDLQTVLQAAPQCVLAGINPCAVQKAVR